MLGAADGVGVVSVDGGSFPTSIQKLFQLAVPRSTTLTSVTGGSIHVARSAASAASETISLIDDMAERLINAASDAPLGIREVADSKRRRLDNAGGNCVRREGIEWKGAAMSVPSSVTGSRANEGLQLHDEWNELTTPPTDLLADSTDDDDDADFSDASNYQLNDVVGSTAGSRLSGNNVNRLICDDDSEEDGCGKLLDPFAGTLNDDYYISSTGGAGDMMWCSGETSWTPDSDLGGMMIFGPN